MTKLGFSIAGASVEPFAVLPTITFRLRINEASGQRIHAIALRCQIRIEAKRRNYSSAEKDRLFDLFGEPERWGETVQSFLWTNAIVLAPQFEGSVEVPLPVPATYDLEVSASKYFEALEDGEIPLIFLFSGTMFVKTPNGFQVEQVPWDREATFRMPVKLWRELMDRYFPGSGWLRLSRETLEALQRFKSRNALLTWDETIKALTAEAVEQT